jgi:hypothetical protein
MGAPLLKIPKYFVKLLLKPFAVLNSTVSGFRRRLPRLWGF